jgi:hypothetical protein
MKDLEAKLEKLLADAEDCDLISKLATDVTKRATFRRLAMQTRAMAEEVRQAIAGRVNETGPTRRGPSVSTPQSDGDSV